MWFQVHHPPLTGVLLIFRSRYLLTIGCQGVFSLTRWSSSIQSGFHVTRPTQVPLERLLADAYGTVTLCGLAFQQVLLAYNSRESGPATPPAEADGLGYFHFARRYFGNRTFFLFHQVLRCFSSLGLPCIPMNSACNNSGIPGSELV